MPSHSRMRAFDRDLIRGGHYGQRSCEPHPKAEHMAAPTNAANVKKVLVNSEPSTHGTSQPWQLPRRTAGHGSKADAGAQPLAVCQSASRASPSSSRRSSSLQRAEEAIVVATGAPRERGCPAWVVLGGKAIEARPPLTFRPQWCWE